MKTSKDLDSKTKQVTNFRQKAQKQNLTVRNEGTRKYPRQLLLPNSNLWTRLANLSNHAHRVILKNELYKSMRTISILVLPLRKITDMF